MKKKVSISFPHYLEESIDINEDCSVEDFIALAYKQFNIDNKKLFLDGVLNKRCHIFLNGKNCRDIKIPLNHNDSIRIVMPVSGG